MSDEPRFRPVPLPVREMLAAMNAALEDEDEEAPEEPEEES